MAQSVYYDELPSCPTTIPVTRHQKHFREEKPVSTESSSGSGYCNVPGGWAAWICIGLVIMGIIGFVLASVSIGKSDTTQATVNAELSQLREDIEAQSKHTSTKMVALSTETHRSKALLCTRQSYYSKQGEDILKNGDKLERVTQMIWQLRKADMKELYYFHLSGRLSLSVTLSTLTIEHSITSSFGRFSTIILEELEFNTFDQSLGHIRNTVLCTNNPFLDTQRCDASLTKRNILVLEGTVRVPFVIETNTTHQEQVIEIGEEERETTQKKQRKEVIGLRMYNLVFLQAEEPTKTVPLSEQANKTRPHGSSGPDIVNNYKEQPILVLDLPQC